MNGFLPEADRMFEVHQIKDIKGDEPVGILHYKSFNDNVSDNLMRLRSAYIVFCMEDVLIGF